MSQLTAVDISDSDRFELAEVLKEESESSSAPRPLEDILQETCDDDFDPVSQRSFYELLSAYIARPTATIVSKNGHSSCSNCVYLHPISHPLRRILPGLRSRFQHLTERSRPDG